MCINMYWFWTCTFLMYKIRIMMIYMYVYICQIASACGNVYVYKHLLMLNMRWLRLVGSIKLQASFAEYRLFDRALLQKRPIIWSILLTEATPDVRSSCTKYTLWWYICMYVYVKLCHYVGMCMCINMYWFWTYAFLPYTKRIVMIHISMYHTCIITMRFLKIHMCLYVRLCQDVGMCMCINMYWFWICAFLMYKIRIRMIYMYVCICQIVPWCGNVYVYRYVLILKMCIPHV